MRRHFQKALYSFHIRWEIFELIGSEPADLQLPHSEDVWVQALRPRNRFALREQRRAVLEATAPKPDESLFGAPLLTTRFAAYLPRGKTAPFIAAERRPRATGARAPSAKLLTAQIKEIERRRLSRAHAPLLPGVDA